jgi:aryl-alcohol dehydrogenase-like predicted oxidoreductase
LQFAICEGTAQVEYDAQGRLILFDTAAIGGKEFNHPMQLTRTAFGTWNGGRFMHYGRALSEAQLTSAIQGAYEAGVRSFVTADVYGAGRADDLLGDALENTARDSYCLVGMVGHDFYSGIRAGAKGYPRFTEAGLRSHPNYASYLREACEKSLDRCRTDRFDLLLLHNPDKIGYTHDAVWDGLRSLKQSKLTERLGIAPGPANGFTLDLIHCFETQGKDIDWAMLILNPFEPWPGLLPLSAAAEHAVKVLARVVDYGGIFHDDLKPGHELKSGDHRSFRPPGWIEKGYEKLNKIRPIAEKHGITVLQLACLWDLAHPPVESVVPTLIQEEHAEAKPLEAKIAELAAVPGSNLLSADEVELIREVGDNTGLMKLKGASDRHAGNEPRSDEWPTDAALLETAQRWNLGSSWSW